ncbi:MAG: DoxX family protein [Pirellulaceae bacterium]|nr:DoxX family protein [Pirellulaceae bacterium]
MHSYARLSFFGIVAIVLLRFGVGYHFYMEGASKVRAGNFESEGFLKAAEGPLASQFHNLIWDYEGKIRLDRDGLKKRFRDAAAQTKEHFKLTDQQTKPLEKLRDAYLDKIDEAFAEGYDDIEKYWVNVKRLDAIEDEQVWNEVSSLNGQMRKVDKDSRAAVADTLATVDAIWTQYERRLNGTPNREQFTAAGPYRFQRPGEGVMTTRLVDQIIPIFDMSIGILLMIGLLTPVASALGALFLLSVVLSQMPGYAGTAPTYFQAVECLSLLVLMATDAGRYAGLDFIPWAWWNRKPKTVMIKPA